MTKRHVSFIFTVLCISLFPTSSISAHIPNDVISTIRERVLEWMIWPSTDNISTIINTAMLYVETLNSSCYWPDINYTDQRVRWLTAEHMTRVTIMLQALTVNGSTVQNNTKLLSASHCALNVWLTNDFKHNFWWFNQIGIPLAATGQLLMLGDNVTDFERKKIIEISYRADWWNGGTIPVGANLVWMIQVQLYRSLATNNITGIEQGFTRMWQDVAVKSPGELGIQNDWSYHFHNQIFLSGTYGTVWANSVILFIACSYGTQYALDSEKLLIVAQLLTKGDAWMIIGNQYDWLVVGREIDITMSDFSAFFNVDSVRFLATLISSIDIQIELNNLADRLENRSNTSLLIGNKHFYTSDYQVHRRANWTTTIKMQSSRVMPVECFNGQNLKGEHLGQGVLNYYTTNVNDYHRIFPLLDWQAINGITVEHGIPLEPCLDGASGLIQLPFVGGVSDGQYGLAMMDTATHNLTAKRSWHFYDDAVIALATNLTLTTMNSAWTTLASRLLRTGQITVGFFNSTIVTLSDGVYSFPCTQDKSTNVQWVHVGGTNIGYLLQQQGPYSSLGIDIRVKTGNYITIGPTNFTVTRRILTIWLDHGQGPYTLDYDYIIVPNVSVELMPSIIKKYDEEQVFSCISTNKNFHGTMWPTLKRASFILWDNITTTFSCKSPMFEINIELSDAGAYLFSETATNFTITASHPMRVNGGVKVAIDRVGYGEGCVVSSDVNASTTNITLALPSSSEFLGASVNVTCKKENINGVYIK